jgi:hypothetical protein
MNAKSSLTVLALLALVLPLRSDTPKPAAPTDQMIAELNQRIALVKQIGELVKQLEDNRFPKRQEASEKLVRIGEPAIEPLRRVLAGKLPLETTQRIEGVLRQIRRRRLGWSAMKESLDRRFNLDKGISANTPLKDALEFLEEKFNVQFQVDSNAFCAIGVQKVEDQPIQLPPMKNARLVAILRPLLAQIKGDVYAGGYLVRPGGVIEITTTYHVMQEVLGPAIAPQLADHHDLGQKPASKEAITRVAVRINRLIEVDFDKRPLNEALKELAEEEGVNLVIDPRVGDKAKTPVSVTLHNAMLETAVRILAELADVKVVQVTNVLYVTTKEHAATLQAEQNKRHYRIADVPMFGGPPAPQ